MTEAISKVVALLPKLEEQFDPSRNQLQWLSKKQFLSIIVAIRDMQGVADGTHVIVPREPTEKMINAAECLATMASWPKPLTAYRAMIGAAND